MDDTTPLLHIAAQAGARAVPLFLATLATLLLLAWLGGRVLLNRHPEVASAQASAPAPLKLLLGLVAGFLVIVGCAALFAGISEHLQTGVELGLADEAFIAALAAHVPDAALRGFYLLTFLGNRETLTALCVVVGALLWARGRRALALGWVLAMAGNGALNPALKQVFERSRPEHSSPWLTEEGFSFPSGHSSGVVVAFGMLAYLAVRLLPPRWHLPALMAAVGLAFSVGASRVFLRVHFPSDVLAGFTSGLAWLMVCITSIELVRWYRRR
jgi:membrane-associated phospholipid phosphatase